MKMHPIVSKILTEKDFDFASLTANDISGMMRFWANRFGHPIRAFRAFCVLMREHSISLIYVGRDAEVPPGKFAVDVVSPLDDFDLEIAEFLYGGWPVPENWPSPNCSPNI